MKTTVRHLIKRSNNKSELQMNVALFRLLWPERLKTIFRIFVNKIKLLLHHLYL